MNTPPTMLHSELPAADGTRAIVRDGRRLEDRCSLFSEATLAGQ
jgi:hypothetical protein